MIIGLMLKDAGLSRDEFATMLGVQKATTYWKSPPAHAITILQQYIELKNYRNIKKMFREIVK